MSGMRKRFTGFICLIAVLTVSALCFSGCGEKNVTLEQMISENPDMARSVEKGLGDINVEGVSPSLDYNKNTVTVTLKYDKTFDEDDAELLAKAFDENGDTFDAACESAISDIKKTTELKKIKIKIKVLNGDSSDMWEKTYGGK